MNCPITLIVRGDVIRLETPGAGGFGRLQERDHFGLQTEQLFGVAMTDLLTGLELYTVLLALHP